MSFYHVTSWSAALNQNPKSLPLSKHYHTTQIEDIIEDITNENITIPIETHNDKTNSNLNDKSQPKSSSMCHTLFGYFVIMIWLSLWVGESEIIPLISTNYNKPFLLRYCVGSCMCIMIPIVYLLNGCKLPKITWNMIWSGYIMSTIYFLATWCWYISLTGTITAINNTIYESQLIYIYILSIIFLPNYKGSMLKNIAVIICILGVVIIGISSLSDHEDDKLHNTTMGIIEVILSSFGYAVFEIMIKLFGDKYFKNNNKYQQIDREPSSFEEVKSMLFMQGMMGTICLLTMWPGLFIVNYTGLEPFEWPQIKDIEGYGVICVMDLFWAASLIIGISMTNPVLMAMCGLLIIPITFVFDVFMFDLTITTMTIIGSMFIIVGFILMEVPIVKILRMMLKYMKCVERDIEHLKSEHDHQEKFISIHESTPSSSQSQHEYVEVEDVNAAKHDHDHVHSIYDNDILEVPDLNTENNDHSIW